MNMREEFQGWYNRETFTLVNTLTNDERLYALTLKALTPYGLPVNRQSFRDGVRRLIQSEGLELDTYKVKWTEAHKHFLSLIGR